MCQHLLLFFSLSHHHHEHNDYIPKLLNVNIVQKKRALWFLWTTAIWRTNCLCKSKWWESSRSQIASTVFPLTKPLGTNIPFNNIYFKCFIQAFEFCEIGFLNSKNFQLRREKASTIRKGKLFKFCFSTDNHLIVGMGKFFAFSDFVNKVLSWVNTKSNNCDTHSLWAINESVTLGHLNDDVFRWNLKMIRQLTFF